MAVIVLAVVLIKGVFGGGTTVSVMDCVNVTISGVDGNGRAYFDFDIQPIFDAVSKKMTLTERHAGGDSGSDGRYLQGYRALR